jgi:hypothetical protein
MPNGAIFHLDYGKNKLMYISMRCFVGILYIYPSPVTVLKKVKKMAPGLDGIVFALTTSLIFTRLLVFPSQPVIRNSNYRTEDLGLYSGSTTIASSSYFDFVIDVLHSRGVPENTRHFQTRKVSRTYKNNVTQYQSSLIRHFVHIFHFR